VTLPNPTAKPQSPRKFKTARTILALVLREMETTFGQSPGGYIWAILKPVAAITLMSFIFSLAFRSPSIGTNFPIFYATGMLPFMLFNETANKTAKALKFSRQLLQYPGVRYMDAIIARFLLNLLTHLMVFYVVMTSIHYIYDLGVFLDLPAILISLAMAAALGLGIGCLNCFLMSMFPVWEQLWGVLTTPLFIISTIIFTFEVVPANYREYLWYNPLVHIVGLMRRGFYPTYDATYVSVTYVFGVALVTLVFGLIFLKRYHREILNL